jgi:microcystin-dependent protein
MVPEGTEYVTREAYANNLYALNTLFESEPETGAHNHTGEKGKGPQLDAKSLLPNAANDTIIGKRTVAKAKGAADTMNLNDILNAMAYVLCSITGESDWKQEAVRTLKSSFIPAGILGTFAMVVPPAGWLKCNGQSYYRTDYPDLYRAIGLRYTASDDGRTFQVPEVRGEFLRCWDDGRGVDPGRVFGSFQWDAVRSHSHTVYSGESMGGAIEGGRGGNQYSSSSTAYGDVETRPRNMAFLVCIKA